jgi:ADP-dependent NAD(P)H-hydrate dehydratase / NAD(P)H-hydrate epimerase
VDRNYWHRQTTDAPLFPDLLWSRPENKLYAGKLLIVGGNAHGFAAAAEGYNYAHKAGIGSGRVLLPDALLKNVSKLFPEAEFAPSTPSGSFASSALGELLPMAHWADGILLAGDLGRNSETAILIESFLRKHSGQVTLTKDAIEYVTAQPTLVADRENTLLVLSFSQLQKLAISLKFSSAFTSDMGLRHQIHGYDVRSDWRTGEYYAVPSR